ncbi:MAG TPA: hypothetical protein VLT62_02430 [Candidatus Methylomirabilis sp.]|nr:hypothetical protein [Candidatus Methylomirabilis sp.]
MRKARVLIVLSALVFTSTSALAEGERELAIIADTLLVRPITIVAIPVSAVIYALASPFAAWGGNLEQTRKVLVTDLVTFAFGRGIGEFEGSSNRR